MAVGHSLGDMIELIREFKIYIHKYNDMNNTINNIEIQISKYISTLPPWLNSISPSPPLYASPKFRIKHARILPENTFKNNSSNKIHQRRIHLLSLSLFLSLKIYLENHEAANCNSKHAYPTKRYSNFSRLKDN